MIVSENEQAVVWAVVDGTFKTTFQIFTKDDFLFTHNGSMFFYVLQRQEFGDKQ